MTVLWIILGCVLIVWIAGVIGVALFAITAPGATDARSLRKIDPDGTQGYADWYHSLQWRDVSITSFDGLRLSAQYLAQGSKNTVILVHGYRVTGVIMLRYARYYQNRGYNILLIDQRAHGDSEGRWISYGYNERHDLAGWVNDILENDPEQTIVLHGESMGAATILQYLGAYAVNDAVPKNIAAAVSDCSFTDAKRALKLANQAWYKIPEFPFFRLSCILDRLFMGYDFSEVSPIELVKEIKIPVLFVHGKADKALPYTMSEQLYQEKTGEKDILLVEGAGHARSYSTAPQLYEKTLDQFLARYVQ